MFKLLSGSSKSASLLPGATIRPITRAHQSQIRVGESIQMLQARDRKMIKTASMGQRIRKQVNMEPRQQIGEQTITADFNVRLPSERGKSLEM